MNLIFVLCNGIIQIEQFNLYVGYSQSNIYLSIFD